MDFKLDFNNIVEGLDKLSKNFKDELDAHAEKSGLQMEAYAKKNAKWKDHSGDARRTLRGGKEWQNDDKVNTYISGNMEYSPYLEYKNDGKYAILQPTVNALSRKILEGIKLK